MEWVLLFVLWAPVVGAVLLRSAFDDPDRSTQALGAYVRAAIFLHALAVPPMLLSYGAALLVLAGFDAALLLAVWAARRDEQQLRAVLAKLRAPARRDEGLRDAREWLDVLGARRGASALYVAHTLAVARALEEAGRAHQAEQLLERLPRAALAPREAARVSLAIALLALERGDGPRARDLAARAIGRAPLGAPEVATARATWALLDAIDGHTRRALIGIGRIRGALVRPLDRALVALTRAHVLASRGEAHAARTVLRNLDPAARARVERLATSCPGPASPLVHGLARPLESPYR